jgi:putative DNA primase/helicase
MIATIRARLHASEVISDPDQRKKAMAWCVGCESATKLESALRVASRREPFRTMVQEYDADPMLAATSGETLDLRAVIRRPVRREDYLTMRLGAAYDPEARADRWRQFLVEVFAGDAEVIAYIQRAVGYSLTGDTREQKLFLLHGSGNNGKSVFLDVLSQLLGDYAGNASFETFDAARRNESTNDLAALRGKRLVTVIETEEGRKLAEARVKSVTGQDQITCRFLYGEYFSYRPEFKIWLAMNHLPIIRGTDRGIWRRIQLIPFTQNFDGREDKTLRDKLMAELPGILGWALEGLRQWHARGLDAPQVVQQAVANYRAESDQIGRWITEQCVVAPQASMPSGAGYKSYHDWCEASGEHAESQNKWGRVLTDKGFDRADVRNVRVWLGIGLRTESEDR